MVRRGWALIFGGLACCLLVGCAEIPVICHIPTHHNPFPQLEKVAILPFYNLSDDPTVDQNEFAKAYATELQKIPGFEVMPPGVVLRYLEARQITIDASTDFQQLARELGVDALVRGAVTEYTAYYPPRIGLSVDWFAANPSFHPIPPGYGLPWGRKAEKHISDEVVFQAEFALAKEQLKTQTPEIPLDVDRPLQPQQPPQQQPRQPAQMASLQQHETLPNPDGTPPGGTGLEPIPTGQQAIPVYGPDGQLLSLAPPAEPLPADWPNPRGFIPPTPTAEPPVPLPQPDPIITHTQMYDGADTDVTERLERYFFYRDDARFGGWQAYLERSEDFTRFCCYLHIADMLTARGGEGKYRVVWRWPIDRYVP